MACGVVNLLGKAPWLAVCGVAGMWCCLMVHKGWKKVELNSVIVCSVVGCGVA